MTERQAELEGFIRATTWCPECHEKRTVWLDPRVDNTTILCPACGSHAATPQSHEGADTLHP